MISPDWAKTLSQSGVLRLLDPARRGAGFFRAEKVLDVVRELLGDVQIREAADPLYRGHHRPDHRKVAVVTARAAGRRYSRCRSRYPA